MTDKVQKIREKVGKRYECWKEKESNSHSIESEIRMSECQHLLLMLDSLQEEPKFKTGDRIKPIDSCLGSPRTIVDVCDSWYVTDQSTLDFEYEDNWEVAEEPVSDSLEEELDKYIHDNFTIEKDQLDKFGIDEKDYMYSMDKSDMLALVEHFTKWQKTNLWKPADGDDLPEIDREVIALLDNGKVVFAHRPNPDGWDGLSFATCKVEHYTPKTYDKGGWNIPNIVYWLDVELPKEMKDE